MAIVTRYFSTTGAGAADGTTWADRAALFSAGNWSTVITGFSFAGSDSLKCLVGPGTYTCGQALATGLFANAPTLANLLFFAGCNGSGTPLTIPDPDWVSAQPPWDDSTLPVIDSTTNIQTVNMSNCTWLLMKFTASGRIGTVTIGGWAMDWCVVVNSTASTAALAASPYRARNCVFSCTGASYDHVVAPSSELFNCRVKGNIAASSGNRRGVSGVAAFRLHGCTVFGNVGDGVLSTSTTASVDNALNRCTLVNNTGAGFKGHATASQTLVTSVEHCQITGNGTYGIDGASASRLLAVGNRLRDNTTANIGNLGNYPIDFQNYTTDSDDATEYVNSGSEDFRIKNTAATWGMGFGAGDEPAAGGGGGGAHILGGTVLR